MTGEIQTTLGKTKFVLILKNERRKGEMAESSNDFDTWLSSKIQAIALDEEVYFEYIKGILEEEDTSEDEIKETLAEILGGVLESDVDVIASEICKKWFDTQEETKTKKQPVQIINPDEKIKSIIEQQQTHVVVVDQSEKLVDNEMKKLVLSQFQKNCSDSEEETNENSGDDSNDPSEFKNINAEAVAQKQQQEREKQKKASDEKKQRDKLNREREKQKKEERQEKEKKRTQKGERKGGR